MIRKKEKVPRDNAEQKCVKKKKEEIVDGAESPTHTHTHVLTTLHHNNMYPSGFFSLFEVKGM